MILVVGATGMLGSEICRLLAEDGRPVRALVRETSNPDRIAALSSLGAELVHGDLKDRPSLDAACRGATAVISTASSTISRQEGDSIETVDHQGQLDLIDAAAAAGVGHFVLVSFPGTDVEFPLQSAKRAAEEHLRHSRMTWTILQPTCFAEVWLSPALGFDTVKGTAQVCGTGENRVSWISFHDVAAFAVAALENPHAKNAVLRLGGPDAVSPLEAVQLAERSTGRRFVVQHIPEAALQAQLATATDPLQQSFAGLMLYCAGGEVIDMTGTLRDFPGQRLTSVREYLEAGG